MKNREDIVKALRVCAEEDLDRCEACPYTFRCKEVKLDAAGVIEEMSAKLDDLSKPTAMPDYEVEYNRLHCENAQLNIQINEMREELVFLRAIKAAAEAFLGREIK